MRRGLDALCRSNSEEMPESNVSEAIVVEEGGLNASVASSLRWGICATVSRGIRVSRGDRGIFERGRL